MNKLTLKVLNYQENKTFCTIDGKPLQFKKDQKGQAICDFETEQSSVEVKICRYLEVNSPFYILWQLLFFFVSILGIFDKPADRHCITLTYRATINLKEETFVKLKLNYLPSKKIGATVVETDTQVMESENVIWVDKNARKKVVLLRVLKIFIWVAFAFLIVFLIMNGS